jgi:hypothetical protein
LTGYYHLSSLSLGFVYFHSLSPIGGDERIIIKFIEKGYDERTWSGFIWLGIRTSSPRRYSSG